MMLTAPPPRLPWPTDVDASRLLGLLQGADLRGRGGAAFPTTTKIASALGRRPVLIVNACDGEPLVAKDEVLLRLAPGLVADGAALVARAVGATEVVLAVHAGSAAQRHAHGLVAGLAGRWPAPRVLAVPHRYVASEAGALASAARGGPSLPFDREQPMTAGATGGRGSVLVLNAETLAQVARAWAGDTVPTRLVTLSGALASTGVVETTDEVTVADLVLGRGGRTAHPPRAVLLGGYGGSWATWDAVASLTLAQLDAGPGLGAGLIHVLGPADCPVAAVTGISDYLAAESAGQCGPCMFGLPALAGDWRELGDGRTASEAWQRWQRRLPVVQGRGACGHPDGAVRQMASALAAFGPHLEQHRAGLCDAVPARERAAVPA